MEVRLVSDDAMRTSSYDIYGLPIDVCNLLSLIRTQVGFPLQVQAVESKDLLELISGLQGSAGLQSRNGTANGHSDGMEE